MSTWWGGVSREVSTQGVCPGGCVCARGGGVTRGWGCVGGSIPACNEADIPPVNRITDRCKNITLPQTLRAVKNMATKGVHIDFMFLAPTRPLDPLLICLVIVRVMSGNLNRLNCGNCGNPDGAL